jgi:4-hydroxybenzoate polyprenyltransferase
MGNWQFIGLWAIIFFGPMLFASLIAIGTAALPYLLFYSLFGIHQTSIIIMNTAEDYLEDLNDGVRTVIVQTGLHKSLKFAWFSIFMSGIGIQLYLIHEFEQIPNTSFAYILSALIFTLSWCTILHEFRAILVQVKGKTDLETTNILKKNGMKVPRWLKIGAYSCLSVIVFIVLLKHKLL